MSGPDRAAALRGLRPVRVENQPGAADEPDAQQSPGTGAPSASGRPHVEALTPELEEEFSYQALLRDPVAVCRSMSATRMDQPARPLNVDLTPETARRFDDLCRTLRLKKKDVVEVLLRGWLADAQRPELPT